VRKRKHDEALGVGAWMFALLALLLAFGAVVVAGQAFVRGNDAKSAADNASGTPVTLTEFKIDPTVIVVDAGGSLTVKNEGSATHNLAIKGTDLKTPDIAPGGTERLDLSSLKPGMYTAVCQISGHAELGMTAMLHVGIGGGGTAAAHGSTKANDAADAAQKKPVDAYVAQLESGANTEGVGAQLPEPTVLADGTKQFDLTAEITDWRDHRLGGVTREHRAPNVTQDPVKPGEQFTYDFVAEGPAVGMYHSHHHAEHQVPDGLMGAFLVGDQPLPPDVTLSQEVPMVLNDAGVIGLTLNGKSFPATSPVIAEQGEWVEIHYMNEGLQIHPMHLHGLPQLVVAKDGFAVPTPYQVDTLNVAPGERYTVLVHATDPGVRAWHCHILTHAEGENGMFAMVTTFIVQ
jgi:uncharacterized cupredoxin-like copper-binding protein